MGVSGASLGEVALVPKPAVLMLMLFYARFGKFTCLKEHEDNEFEFPCIELCS